MVGMLVGIKAIRFGMIVGFVMNGVFEADGNNMTDGVNHLDVVDPTRLPSGAVRSENENTSNRQDTFWSSSALRLRLSQFFSMTTLRYSLKRACYSRNVRLPVY